MKKLALISLFTFSAGLFAQDAIPVGTILPVQLNSSLRSDKAKSGQPISARIMQDIPDSTIRAGAKVLGHVVEVRPASNGTGAEIALRFDTLVMGNRRIPVTTNLRALAGMMEVSDAHVPDTGADRGTSEYSWTTDLIGGEVNYGSRGAVLRGSYVVGNSVPGGVLARVTSKPGTKCGGPIDANDRPQALWVFSSDACGLYGYHSVTLTHSGRTDPIGEIVLQSQKGNLNMRAGSGMLLRVNSRVNNNVQQVSR